MARYLLLSLVFVLAATFASAQTAVEGKVTDKGNGEELIGANIQFFKGGNYAAGAATDFNGNYKVNLDPGTYDVTVSYVGFPDNQVTGVVIKAGQVTALNIELEAEGVTMDEVIVTAYTVPLIDKDNTTQGGVVTSEQIRTLPTKSISALASTTAGLSQVDEGDAVTVRGSRSDGTDYYIDGIRVSSSQLPPESEIEQLQVITGGIEAQYGDVTGGIISITTKGPSKRYSGSIEVETSEFLDPYGYNLINGNISGPIIKKKGADGIEKSILGFRLSGRYRYQKDDDPPATDVFRVKDNVLDSLILKPIVDFNGTPIPGGEFLLDKDVDRLDYRPNEQNERLDITAKLDARLSDNIDITISGTFADTKNKFTPTSAGRAVWRLMNSQNNPTDMDQTYRGNFRFRHKLGRQNSGGDEARKASIIQNAQYTLQFGYQKQIGELSDPRHGDDLFAYGYVGRFDFDYTPAFDTTGFFMEAANFLQTGVEEDRPNPEDLHVDYSQPFIGYTADEIYNPILARYNQFSDTENINNLVARNGFFVGRSTSIHGFHTNIGQVYNLNQKNDNDLLTFTATSSFDLLPGGSEKGRHSIQFGFIYEQRYSRDWRINPRHLWVEAGLAANEHFQGLNREKILYMQQVGAPFSNFGGEFIYDEVPVYDVLLDENGTKDDFYLRVREIAGGLATNEFVNVQALTPDQLSLDLFGPRRVIDSRDGGGRIIDFYGYDYLGNKLGNDVTFDDFFSARDAEGNRTFPVAPFKPNYFAAYVQDKFTFKDIIFRVGLRVDRYDANTKVLKDQLSVFPIQSAKDFFDSNGGSKPGAVGDDFSVYTDGAGSIKVKAFRDGEQWYTAEGSPVNDPVLIFGPDPAFPAFEDQNSSLNIQNEDFDPARSFEDYEPQINWMPRLAFSFPISENANFFAHYDVLVQRPPSNTLATALDYFYFQSDTPTSNPDLKPEKTVDYEVGFQQKLSNTSAIKVAAYYKEMRDMIQRRTLLYSADVNQYDSFGNIDFGTVKGFTFQYDLRRTGNVSASINYTLQFADGTGSDANSQQGLTGQGRNIRNLFPLNFDERHRIVTSIDYRYGAGSRYNGPRWFGKDVFANAGVNIQAITVSGRPYTAESTPAQFGGDQFIGSLNGARKPWTFTLNLRVDKSFTLSRSEKFPLDLNVYFRVSNILDRRNVVNLYSASGSSNDDGYLASPLGQQRLTQVEAFQLDSFIDSYQWAMLRPDFYSLPRRMYLGAIFEF